MIINGGKLAKENEKRRNLKKSLSKRADKQAEIRDHTAQKLNSAFVKYASAVYLQQCFHTYDARSCMGRDVSLQHFSMLVLVSVALLTFSEVQLYLSQ